MLNKIHEILRDKDCAGNIQCFTWAFVCVMVYLSVFLYGFGVFGLSEELKAIDMRTRIELRQEFEQQLNAHRHKLFSGKVVTEQNKSNKKP